MRSPNLVENDLVERAQRGDEAAAREITERLWRPMAGFLFRMLGPRFVSQMDDIAQDVFLKVFTTIDRFDFARRVRFSTWVFTYARNHCVDLLKKKRLPTVDLAAVSDGPFEARLVDERAVQPLRAVESVEIRERIDEAMCEIAEQHRRVLVLRERGLGYPEIADRLGVAPGTVKSRLHRARAALRRELSDLNPAHTAA